MWGKACKPVALGNLCTNPRWHAQGDEDKAAQAQAKDQYLDVKANLADSVLVVTAMADYVYCIRLHPSWPHTQHVWHPSYQRRWANLLFRLQGD